MDGTTVGIAVLGLLVGTAVAWALGRRRGARRLRAAGGSRVLVLENDVRRLGSRSDELDALLELARRESARLHQELTAARAQGDRQASDTAGLRLERDALAAGLAEERAAREQDRAEREAAAQAQQDAAVAAAELELAQARARDAEADGVILRARLDARDAALTELQQKVAALEAKIGGPEPEPDDLRMIEGVGRVLEGMLHEAGITTYDQVAELSAAEGPDGGLDEFLGRIKREEWSDQARELHRRKHGEDNGRSR